MLSAKCCDTLVQSQGIVMEILPFISEVSEIFFAWNVDSYCESGGKVCTTQSLPAVHNITCFSTGGTVESSVNRI